MVSIQTYIEGFSMGATLIIAIGAQNAYVLRQGIRKQFVFITPLICSCIDVILITAGVLGAGSFIASNKLFLTAAMIFGVFFLIYYGTKSFFAAFMTKETLDITGESAPPSLNKHLITLLSFTLLNPHVYLDTVVLLGSISARYPFYPRLGFGLGAVTASFVWFFGLSYGASFLHPFFKKRITWKILDLLISLIMFYIAFKLIIFTYHNL